MDNFSGEDTEASWNFSPGVLQECVRSLFSVLAESTFGRFQERVDLGIQIADTLVGSFQLCPHTTQF
jgi:hypothetical protein